MSITLSVVAGFALVIAGVALLLPVPELGIVLVFAGLRLLGRRFAWARRLNRWVDDRVRAFRTWWRGRSRPVRGVLVGALALALGALVFWLAS